MINSLSCFSPDNPSWWTRPGTRPASTVSSTARRWRMCCQVSLNFSKLCRLYLKLLPMSLSCIHVAFGKSIVLTTASMFTLEGGWSCQHQWTPNNRCCSDNIRETRTATMMIPNISFAVVQLPSSS